MTPARWSALMHALGIGPELATYERLVTAYAEPHRRYHTGPHITACLAELDAAPDLSSDRPEVELALWFHDAVYSTTASDNEARSAAWASAFLASAGVSATRSERVQTHILATRHEAQPEHGDSALVVDIDLSILGRSAVDYDQFERDIREEYRWVPSFLYKRKRCEILQSFLERDSIYTTPYFRDRYEGVARSNLRNAVRALRKRADP